MKYTVTWEIDIWADSYKEAAIKALVIQRNINSIATVFHVTSDKDQKTETIDLNEE
jgi:hypothetical protein